MAAIYSEIFICAYIYTNSEPAFYRSVIVYTAFGATVVGLVAITVMKALEIRQQKKELKDNVNIQEEVNPHPETQYGTMQNGKNLLACPL